MGVQFLSEWRLKNFKSVKDERVQLAPLTVLVGVNSSGKSSLLQSILVARQSAMSEATDDKFILSGSVLALGSFEELAHAASREPTMSIGGTATLDPDDLARSRRFGPTAQFRPSPRQYRSGPRRTVSWQIDLKGAPADDPASALIDGFALKVKSGNRILLEVSGQRSGERVEAEARGRSRRRFMLEERERRVFFEEGVAVEGEAALQLHGAGFKASPVKVEGARLIGGLPIAVFVRWSERDRQAWELVEAALGTPEFALHPASLHADGPETLAAEPAELLQQALNNADELVAAAKKRERVDVRAHRLDAHFLARTLDRLNPDVVQRSVPVIAKAMWERIRSQVDASEAESLLLVEEPFALQTSVVALQGALRDRIRYLGPLREEPRGIYQPAQSGRLQGDVGSRGEYAAAALHSRRNTIVWSPNPRTQKLEQRKLGEAIVDWLQELGIGSKIATEALVRLGIDIRIFDTRVERGIDLLNVGVGVSQVLPVLAMCLLSPPGSLIMLEQPELHLHPALQQKLADFLLAIARTKCQLIVETHSEHLVSRLRRHIAEDYTDEFVDEIRILFAERDEGGATKFRHVPVNRFGAVDPDQWPEGFFDQAPNESASIVEAAMLKLERDESADAARAKEAKPRPQAPRRRPPPRRG